MMNIFETLYEKVVINETVNQIINYLNEDRGISSIVFNCVMEANNALLESISKTDSIPLSQYKGITFKKGEFNITFDRDVITIKWQWYNFKTKEFIEDGIVPNNKGKMIKKMDGYEINLIVEAVSGKTETARAMEVLQHELEHLWERKNYGKSYGNMDLYKFSEILMNDTVNEYNRYIGIILYLSKKWEQRAFANGVYGYLLNHENNLSPRVNVKETQLFNALIKLKDALKKIKEVGNNWEHFPLTRKTALVLKTEYNFGYDKIMRIGYETIENITRILGRTLSKAEQDIEKKHNLTNIMF